MEPFFEGWPNPPDAEDRLRILEGSSFFIVARDRESGDVLGFITVLTDGVLAASIPLLEVRPDARGHGIGSQLVRRALDEIGELYMVDLTCDPHLRPFYERFDFQSYHAMIRRRR